MGPFTANEPRAPTIIGQHWIPYFKEKGHLPDCPPKDFSYPEGWFPLYTRAGVLEHVSNLEHVLSKEKSIPLIAVVLPKVDFYFDKELSRVSEPNIYLPGHSFEKADRLLPLLWGDE